jgi:cytidylate kinase
MSNILLEYMRNRLTREAAVPAKKKASEGGPVLTISREYGCPAKRLAGMLTTALNRVEIERFSKHRWKWIGKEILEESAKELNLKPDMVRSIITEHEPGLLDDIVLSLSHKYYPGDVKIKRTFGSVIRTFAEEGHVVIVGRGGASITRDIPRSLHIKLHAPMEWRVGRISENYKVSLEEAEKTIREIDHKRQLIRDFFEGHKAEDAIFDIILNYKTIPEEDQVALILKAMEQKGLI